MIARATDLPMDDGPPAKWQATAEAVPPMDASVDLYPVSVHNVVELLGSNGELLLACIMGKQYDQAAIKIQGTIDLLQQAAQIAHDTIDTDDPNSFLNISLREDVLCRGHIHMLVLLALRQAVPLAIVADSKMTCRNELCDVGLRFLQMIAQYDDLFMPIVFKELCAGDMSAYFSVGAAEREPVDLPSLLQRFCCVSTLSYSTLLLVYYFIEASQPMYDTLWDTFQDCFLKHLNCFRLDQPKSVAQAWVVMENLLKPKCFRVSENLGPQFLLQVEKLLLKAAQVISIRLNEMMMAYPKVMYHSEHPGSVSFITRPLAILEYVSIRVTNIINIPEMINLLSFPITILMHAADVGCICPEALLYAINTVDKLVKLPTVDILPGQNTAHTQALVNSLQQLAVHLCATAQPERDFLNVLTNLYRLHVEKGLCRDVRLMAEFQSSIFTLTTKVLCTHTTLAMRAIINLNLLEIAIAAFDLNMGSIPAIVADSFLMLLEEVTLVAMGIEMLEKIYWKHNIRDLLERCIAAVPDLATNGGAGMQMLERIHENCIDCAVIIKASRPLRELCEGIIVDSRICNASRSSAKNMLNWLEQDYLSDGADEEECFLRDEM